jgi:hypothetical protein
MRLQGRKALAVGGRFGRRSYLRREVDIAAAPPADVEVVAGMSKSN